MRTVTRSLLGLLAILASISLGVPAAAQATDPDGYGDGYQAGNYGRVRYVENGVTIERAAEGRNAAGDRASVNAPIFPGDTVRTGEDGRVEIQLAGGTLLRLDSNSSILLQSLPDPYAKYQDNSVIVLRGGRLRVSSRVPDKQELRIDTEASSVFPQGDGEFRIGSDDRGRTSVGSFRGVAEVGGASGSVLVRGGTATFVEPGSVPADPSPFRVAAEDGFDRWCDARDAAYRSHDTYAAGSDAPRGEDVPQEVRPYYGELSTYGTWTNVPDYGTVWYPSGVASGWRPYSDGSWNYGPNGYFWVGAEPWGWAPYHYGCWQWVASFGWCWVPGHVFGGAWVSWSWGSAFVGWAPLDFWGRPCWMGGPRVYGVYDPGCWNFVGYGNLAAGNVGRYAVPVGHVGVDLQNSTVVARAPRIGPRELARDPLARQRAVHQVGEDRGARMRPLGAGSAPERRLLDVQNQLLRRMPAGTWVDHSASRSQGVPASSSSRAQAPEAPHSAAPAPRAGAAAPQQGFPRRIYDDPRGVDRTPARSTPGGPQSSRPPAAPDSREHVRDFYQRMSRPRETQQPDPRRDAGAPERSQMRGAPPQPSRDAVGPRYQAPEPARPQYRAPAPRYEPPRTHYEAPRGAPAPPRPQASPHGAAPAPPRPKNGPKGR